MRRVPAAILASVALSGCFDLASDESGLTAVPGLTSPCFEAPRQLAGVGRCRLGFTVNYADEEGVVRSECLGQVLAAPEVCNGVDDDCDGATDNHGVCSEDSLADLELPGMLPFILLEDDRIGPALVKHPHDGRMASCVDDDFAACADAFVASHGETWGQTKDSGVSLVRASEHVVSSHAHIRYRQLYRGVPVEGASLIVHLVEGEPKAITGVTARVAEVRADLPSEPAVPLDALTELAGSGALLDTELVVLPGADPAAAVEDPTLGARLAWRVTTTSGAASRRTYVAADSGDVLATVSLALEDVIVTAPGKATVTAQYDEGAHSAYATTAKSPEEQAARAATQTLEIFASLFGAEAFFGDGAWPDVTVSVQETGQPCPSDCTTTAGTRGWVDVTAPRAPHVCCVPPPPNGGDFTPSNLDIVRDATRHELVHGLLALARPDLVANAPTVVGLEGEAALHGLVEMLAETVECLASDGSGCAFQHAGRSYAAMPDLAKQCTGKLVKVKGAPTAKICEAPSEDNRRLVGHALRRAACLLTAGCTAQDCGSPDKIGACGSLPARRMALATVARVVFDAWRDILTGLLLKADVYAAVIKACVNQVQALPPSEALDPHVWDPCTALQKGFADTGIAMPCANPLACEACDGLDNDCNGYFDDGPTKTQDESLTQPCPDFPADKDGVGLCKRGTQSCHGKAWGACEDQVEPAGDVDAGGVVHETLCDGKDNDCDGETDEEGLLGEFLLDQDYDGFGAPGASKLLCTSPPPPDIYIPFDPSADRDCDDDRKSVNPGEKERCNTLYDDNCNGVSNEGCVCQPNGPPIICGPGKAACYGQPWGASGCESPMAPGDPASCSVGEQTCAFNSASGQFEVSSGCAGAKLGQTEICDGKDNDCDGEIDEDVKGLAAKCGLDGKGKELCAGGKVICEGTSDTLCTTSAVPPTQTDKYVPPHVGGDKDFDGGGESGGPHVTAEASLKVQAGHRVVATVYMHAKETMSDWTEAKGTTSVTIVELPASCTISKVSFGSAVSTYEYTDKSTGNADVFAGKDAGPVATWEFYGDRGGNDAGTFTGVILHLKPFSFTACCKP